MILCSVRQTDRQKKKRLDYLDIAKGIGIILVVIGHCIPDAASPAGVSVPFYRVLHHVIYSFHMPLFFFIAGFLTYKQGQSVLTSKNKIARIKKRVQRLLVPYLFVGICYMPMKLLLSQFANKAYDVHEFWKIVIGVNPDGELWFLYALFVITVIAVIFGERISRLGLLIVAIITLWAPILPIVTSNLFYFFLGIYIKQRHDQLFYNMNKFFTVSCLLIFLVANGIGYLHFDYSFLRLITSVTGISLTLYLSCQIEHSQTKIVQSLKTLGIFSMDIYILSDIIKIPFRVILWNKFHLYTLSFLVCTIAAIALSYWISKYFIRPNKYFKRLILGA